MGIASLRAMQGFITHFITQIIYGKTGYDARIGMVEIRFLFCMYNCALIKSFASLTRHFTNEIDINDSY